LGCTEVAVFYVSSAWLLVLPNDTKAYCLFFRSALFALQN